MSVSVWQSRNLTWLLNKIIYMWHCCKTTTEVAYKSLFPLSSQVTPVYTAPNDKNSPILIGLIWEIYVNNAFISTDIQTKVIDYVENWKKILQCIENGKLFTSYMQRNNLWRFFAEIFHKCNLLGKCFGENKNKKQTFSFVSILVYLPCLGWIKNIYIRRQLKVE